MQDGAIRPCDNTSVGVIVIDGTDRYLLIERSTPPFGIAPVAGHIDNHGGPQSAARNEVNEEVGLTILNLRKLCELWRPNPCRRPAGPGGIGHHWTLYQATVEGELRTSPDEVRAARWINTDELQALAERTAAHARGHLTSKEFLAKPGLQPVWVHFLAVQRLIRMSQKDLAAVDGLD